MIILEYIRTYIKSNLKAKQMHWLHGRSTLSKEYKRMEFSYGSQPPIPTSKSSREFNPRLSDPL
jgi:hypothetical protein